MKLDKAGIDLIKQFEGFSAYPYNDSAGLPTIGYGHLILAGEAFPHDLSIEEAEIILFRDAQAAMDAVNSLVDVPLSQSQFNALVSLVYNIGAGAFSRSTLLKWLNDGNYQAAREQFAVWRIAGGEINQGLVNRRTKEASLFA